MSPEPQREMTDEEFKRVFPLPSFHEAKRLELLGVLNDSNGTWWAFIQYPRNWMHVPWSARILIDGKKLRIALPMRWSDENPPPPSGDSRFLDQFAVEKEPNLTQLLERVKTSDRSSWIGAAELPFRPDAIEIVDR